MVRGLQAEGVVEVAEAGDKFFLRAERAVAEPPLYVFAAYERYFCWIEGDGTAILDGRFTPEELIQIARGVLLRNANGVRSTSDSFVKDRDLGDERKEA